MIDILLYGCDKFNERYNKEILHTIDYIKSSKRFEKLTSLFYYYFYYLILPVFFVSNFQHAYCFSEMNHVFHLS